MEHTNGDWRVIATTLGNLHIMSDHNNVIADVRDTEDRVEHDAMEEWQKNSGKRIEKPMGKESVANAFVIAASTKLLAACKAMVKENDGICPHMISQETWDDMETAIKLAKSKHLEK